MGDPDVFELVIRMNLCAVGASWSRWNENILDINFFLPFICLRIFCKKTKANKWFSFRVEKE